MATPLVSDTRNVSVHLNPTNNCLTGKYPIRNLPGLMRPTLERHRRSSTGRWMILYVTPAEKLGTRSPSAQPNLPIPCSRPSRRRRYTRLQRQASLHLPIPLMVRYRTRMLRFTSILEQPSLWSRRVGSPRSFYTGEYVHIAGYGVEQGDVYPTARITLDVRPFQFVKNVA